MTKEISARVLACTALQGLAQACLAHTSGNPIAVTSIMLIGSGLCMTCWAATRPDRTARPQSWRASLWAIRRLVFLEAGHMLTLVVALHTGTVATVAALHLTSPVMMMASRVRSRPAPHQVASVVLVVGAAGLALLLGGMHGSHPAVSVVLALVSAGLLATLISSQSSLIATERMDPSRVGGLVDLSAGLALVPAVFLATPAAGADVAAAAIGLLAVGPSLLFLFPVWRRPNVDVIAVGMLLLTEACTAAVAALVVFGDVPTPVALVGAVMALLASAVHASGPLVSKLRAASTPT